jgi:hypothetical protein
MNINPQNSLTSRDNHRDWASPQSPASSLWRWLIRVNDAAEPELDSLNRTLVAGLMLEVMLKNPSLVEERSSGRHRLKACLRRTLAVYLAGRIPLASFHTLAQGLDHWFEVIYPLLADAGLTGPPPRRLREPLPSKDCALREDLFSEALENTPRLLPHRRHRKLDWEKLRNFLESTGGNWFRLRDFESHFQVDRKTAWEYVHKLVLAGLLVHNQGHSSAVRYQVAPRFLEPNWASPSDHAGETAPAGHSH